MIKANISEIIAEWDSDSSNWNIISDNSIAELYIEPNINVSILECEEAIGNSIMDRIEIANKSEYKWEWENDFDGIKGVLYYKGNRNEPILGAVIRLQNNQKER